MRKLTGRRLDIALGHTDHSPYEVLKYRELWKDKFDLPEYTPPVSIPHLRRVPGVGTIVARKLSWFAIIGAAPSGCSSCKTKMEQMDARRVTEWNEETILKDAKEISDRREGLANLVPSAVTEATIAYNIREAVKEHKAELKRLPQRGHSANFGTAFKATGVPEFVRSQDLQKDILTLASMIPSDVTAIAGVARSGLSVATMISMYLHLPMFTVRQTANDVQDTGNGWRLGGLNHVTPTAHKVCVIDDTVMTGNSFRTIDTLLRRNFSKFITAAVYVNPKAKKKPDIWVRDLGWPHLLEWNLFNSVLSPNMACDFDGILCHDCPRGSDDDGPKYLEFINNAPPLYVPRKVAIPLIITARIEKYRKPTTDWLNKWGIKVNKLIMHPASTLKERQRQDIAKFKATHFMHWAKTHRPKPPPIGFVESEDNQAKAIAARSGLMTICPGTGKVY